MSQTQVNRGQFNGVHGITVIPEPASGDVYLVTSLRLVNLDTVAHTFTISANPTDITESVLYPYPLIGPVLPGYTVEVDNITLVTGRSLVISMLASKQTTQPQFEVRWFTDR